MSFALLALALAGATPGGSADSRTIELRLRDAVFRGERASGDAATLIVLLRRDGGGWERAWGVARDLNVRVHEGTVIEGSFAEGSFDFVLEMKIEGATPGEGGRAEYRAKLPRAEDGIFRGEYSGRFRRETFAGKAEAVVLPPDRAPAPGFAPVSPGEHPRILFRSGDLPHLRERAETPVGRAAVARLVGPIGLGIRYRLTGDASLAREIIPMIQEMIPKGLMSDQYGNNVGDRLEKTAIAYDLCRDAWPPEFVKEVERYMAWAADGVLRGRQDAGGGINWNICSNWSAPLYAGAGFAGLALWGEKGPAPEKPMETRSGSSVPAPPDYVPGKDVPVAAFESDRMPPEWIYAGGFRIDERRDALEAIGGASVARPEVGTAVSCADRTEAFRPLSHEKDKGYYRMTRPDKSLGREQIDVTNAIGRVLFSTNYFYSVVRNDRPRWVRLATGSGSALAFLSGVRLSDGDVAFLEAGLHPFLIVFRHDWMNSWGRYLIEPRLVEIAEADAKALAACAREESEAAIADWNRDVDEWKRLGGQSVAYRKLFERGRHDMYVFAREAVGTGGMQSEVSHYSNIATRPPCRYAAAFRKMFGRDVSPYADLTMVLPRKIFTHIYPERGTPFAQEINGQPDADGSYFAILFPLVPEEWRPAILWAWERHLPVAKEGSRRPAAGFAEAAAAADPVYTLLHFPLGLEPRSPAGILPLAWEAPDYGFYGFRSGWQGGEDFIVQLFLKAHTLGGWNGPNAGTFRVAGLGHVWAWGTTDRNRHRWEESVVQLPEDPDIHVGGRAHATYVKMEPGGSGVVSMDLGEVYASVRRDAAGRPMRPYERYGNLLRESALDRSRIRGTRSFAVDYSGKSGCPCLIAIVDIISGGKSKVWTWQLDRAVKGGEGKPEERGDLSRTRVEGNSFIIRKDDGEVLKGTFLTRHRVSADVKQTTMIGGAGSSAGKELARPIPGVFAEGGDAFFIVVTIGKGEPPAVKVEGESEGLRATAAVGGQTVRFDGEKIVLGR